MTTEDAATSREIRDSPLRGELETMPGVQQVVFPCTTIEECRRLQADLKPA